MQTGLEIRAEYPSSTFGQSRPVTRFSRKYENGRDKNGIWDDIY